MNTALKQSLIVLAFGVLSIIGFVTALHAQINFPLPLTVEWDPSPATDNVLRYEVTIDANTPIAVQPSSCTASLCSLNFSIANEGPHTISVRAVNDWATGPPGSVTFTAKGPAIVNVRKVHK